MAQAMSLDLAMHLVRSSDKKDNEVEARAELFSLSLYPCRHTLDNVQGLVGVIKHQPAIELIQALSKVRLDSYRSRDVPRTSSLV